MPNINETLDLNNDEAMQLAMQKKIRLIVAGSRPPKGIEPKIAKGMLDEYRALIFSHLDNLLSNVNLDDVAIVSGMAAGADMIGYEYARQRGLPVIEMPANWELNKKSAGYIRNKEMADVATHAAIYYDGQSKGSAHMIEIAKKKGLALRVEEKQTQGLFDRYTQTPIDRSAGIPPQALVMPAPAPTPVIAPTAEKTPSIVTQPAAAPLVMPEENIENSVDSMVTENEASNEAPAKSASVTTADLDNLISSNTCPTCQTEHGSNAKACKPKAAALLATVTPFEPPTADTTQIQAAISEPERFRIIEQMQNIMLEVQEGVDQMPDAAKLPLKIADKVGDEIPIVMLDLETTGLDATKNQIIEVGLVRCMASPSTGQITSIERACSLLEEPDLPLSEEIIRITGITDSMLIGHTIDDAQVASYFDDAPLVIAHNAAFDRPFFENRFKELQGMNWVCSIKQAPWDQKGFESSKLEYLGLKSGFYYTGHRAAIDALAIVELLNRHPDVFPYMLEASERLPITFRALGAPFSVKDELKEAGFRWDDGSNSGVKAWYYTTEIEGGFEKVDKSIEDHKAWMKTLYGSKAASCGVELGHTWQRYMSNDLVKSCSESFEQFSGLSNKTIPTTKTLDY